MTKSLKRKADLSIVIVNYNTEKVLYGLLQSIKSLKTGLSLQVIISDNGSSDGSIDMVKKSFPKYELIENKKNLGFSKGNNAARKLVKSDTILFLNSDTLVNKTSLNHPYKYLNTHNDVGAITVKTILPNGRFDPDMIRSFPTPFVSLTHFSGMDKIFPKSRLFSKYQYGYLSRESIQEIEVAQGSYFMVKKSVLHKVGWFDEDYFLDGEDIDICWRIREIGKKIIYFPEADIIHLKKASKSADRRRSLTSILCGVEAMEIFYKKHLMPIYPFYVNYLVFLGIKILKIVRITKFYLKI